VSRHAEWSYIQQGRRLMVQSLVMGVVELIALDGRCVQRVAVSRRMVPLIAPHGGLWLLRWTPRKGYSQVRQVMVK